MFQYQDYSYCWGGAKELGIVYISIVRGATEPRNLQNHRGEEQLFVDLKALNRLHLLTSALRVWGSGLGFRFYGLRI